MKRVIGAALLAGVLLMASAGPATADGPIIEPGPSTTLQFRAGDVCEFAVGIETILNQSLQKVFLAASGEPERIILTGRVILRLSNLEAGTSIDVNASGPALVIPHDDGSISLVGHGRGIQWFTPANEEGPSLLLILGRATLDISPTGDVSNFTAVGTTRDLCAALAA